jgi:hypothetical protein
MPLVAKAVSFLTRVQDRSPLFCFCNIQAGQDNRQQVADCTGASTTLRMLL